MSITLQHIDDFREVLTGYSPSEEARAILAQTPLVIFLGITGSGRNTIINHLVETGKYHFIVSDTTRPAKFRDGRMEEDGVQYHFRSEDEVLDDLKNGKFLEAEVIHNQQVSGISIRELDRAYKSGKIPTTEVDIEGTVNILKAKPDTKMFFIVPPNYGEWIHRLTHREQMSDQELKNRTETAIRVLKTGLKGEHFSFVINEYSHLSAEMIDKQFNGEKDRAHDAETRKIAAEILEEIEKNLHIS